MTFRPMRAAGPDPKKGTEHFWNNLRYPLLCSPKIDGIRGCSRGGVVTSRSGEPLPSRQVQEELGAELHWVDCEITEGKPNDFGVYNRTQSHVMSDDSPGALSYHVFDFIHPDALHLPFYERLEEAKAIVNEVNSRHPSPLAENRYNLVEHVEIEGYQDLLLYEHAMLEQGWEGIMGRDPVAPYKQGKATYNQGWLYKFKRFTDTEAILVGFEEQLTNSNEQTRSELGYAKRSTAKAGMLPAGTLGKFIVHWQGTDLTVGCGVFTHKERQHIWDNQEEYRYKLLKFRYFSHGVKDLPRFPRAVGFRSPMDL